MDRFISIALVLFSAVVSVLSKQPHILFIVADDYGYHDIGYHNSEIKTPVLDDLAKKGVKLENYYVQPICTPTRSQLMSGRYQIHTGMQHGILWWTQPAGLPLGDPTLPDKLKAAGYSTHMIGKWHLGFWKKEYVPTHRGFDTFYGFYGGSETYYNHGSCASLEKGFCGYDFRDGETVDKSAKGKYSTHIFGERAVKVIKGHNTNKPMFMYMSFQAPHAPLEVPANYERQYSHLPDSNRRKYAGMVTAMDEAVGNITKALQEKHMLDDTIIVFTSDNGGEIRVGGNNYPLRGQKGSLFEGGMRAVGFVNSKLIPAGKHGTINHELIHVTDWYPTLVKLGQGNTHGTHLDGVDQWATISQGKSSPRTEILHNIDPRKFLWGTKMGGVSFDTRIRAALRKGNWKIITGEPGNGTWSPHPHIPANTPLSHDPGHKNLWLFNIATDPEERHDVSAQHTDVVHQLLDRLHHYQSTAVPVVYPAADARSNPHLHGGVWGPWDSSPAVIVG